MPKVGNSRHSRDQGTEGQHDWMLSVVSINDLKVGPSPRLNGCDDAHIKRLSETEAALPPILVDRRSMQVIDGMHRVMAAVCCGQRTIEVKFFDGDSADAFLRAVEANVTHGLPLSQADRRAAAARIVSSHPHLSDRAVAKITGLAAGTIAAVRRSTSGRSAEPRARVGRDGKARPLDLVEGRRRVMTQLARDPDASIRQIARKAGVSPATVHDVRKRLERGEAPIPRQQKSTAPAPDGSARAGGNGPAPIPGRRPDDQLMQGTEDSYRSLQKLLRDPSLRHNESGRQLLYLLQVNAVGARRWHRLISTAPPYSATLIARVARQYGHMWLKFAEQLEADLGSSD